MAICDIELFKSRQGIEQSVGQYTQRAAQLYALIVHKIPRIPALLAPSNQQATQPCQFQDFIRQLGELQPTKIKLIRVGLTAKSDAPQRYRPSFRFVCDPHAQIPRATI
jgi:hypothetical protein